MTKLETLERLADELADTLFAIMLDRWSPYDDAEWERIKRTWQLDDSGKRSHHRDGRAIASWL